MNIRLIIGLIFIIIILGGLGLFFMNEQNTKQITERMGSVTPVTPAGNENTETSAIPNAATATTSDGRVSFQYPENWYLKDTTVAGKKGKFGTIMQSLIVQNVPFPTSGGVISDNIASIDITVQAGGANLSIDDLVDCGMKTTTCTTIGIDNEQFIRADSTLNTGMKTVTIGTFYDNKILLASALITPGDQETALAQSVNDILNSFTFSELPQGKD